MRVNDSAEKNAPVSYILLTCYFTVVAEGSSFQLAQSSGSQHRGRTPPEGHQINLRGQEMTNEREEMKG